LIAKQVGQFLKKNNHDDDVQADGYFIFRIVKKLRKFSLSRLNYHDPFHLFVIIIFCFLYFVYTIARQKQTNIYHKVVFYSIVYIAVRYIDRYIYILFLFRFWQREEELFFSVIDFCWFFFILCDFLYTLFVRSFFRLRLFHRTDC